MFNDEELSQAIGETIGEVFPDIYGMYKENINTFLNEKGPALLDSLLGGKTLIEIVSILHSLVKDPRTVTCQ